MKAKDITGIRYGELTAIEFAEYGYLDDGRRFHIWRFLCDCGNVILKRKGEVTRLNSYVTHCGCRMPEIRKRIAEKHQKQSGESAFHLVYKGYIDNAKTRNLDFLLTKEEFRDLTKLNCTYCGAEPSMKRTVKSGNGECVYNGVDRIDSSQGYSAENCVPCCRKCNVAKFNFSYDEFTELIIRIYNHLNLKEMGY